MKSKAQNPLSLAKFIRDVRRFAVSEDEFERSSRQALLVLTAEIWMDGKAQASTDEGVYLVIHDRGKRRLQHSQPPNLPV
jgi:hypothetical protein